MQIDPGSKGKFIRSVHLYIWWIGLYLGGPKYGGMRLASSTLKANNMSKCIVFTLPNHLDK